MSSSIRTAVAAEIARRVAAEAQAEIDAEARATTYVNGSLPALLATAVQAESDTATTPCFPARVVPYVASKVAALGLTADGSSQEWVFVSGITAWYSSQ